jgi:Leucine-rich repeat (LRR) protein
MVIGSAQFLVCGTNFLWHDNVCMSSGSMNTSTVTSATKMKKCKVVEKKDSIGRGEGSGRSCLQLLQIDTAATETTETPLLDWDELLGQGNGYLSLRNKNVVALDVPGIIESICLADGLVTQLGLSMNSLKGPGTVSLVAELLRPVACFQNIQALYLSNNSIGDAGALVIAELISSRRLPIRTVGLNSNDISDVGAVAIAKTLINSGSEDGNYICNNASDNQLSIIEVLGLSHNHITSSGASSIAQALSQNTSMRRLFLNYNPLVGEAGGLALAAAARGHPSLLRLGVAFCSLSSESGEALMNVLSSTDSIERICVSGNRFDIATENRMQEMNRFNFAEVK